MNSLNGYIQLSRPKQWIKNVAVLTSLPFGWLNYGLSCTDTMLLAAALFCLMSSAVYALNDVVDRAADQLHPEKKSRPIASGTIAPWRGATCAVILAAVALGLSSLIPSVTFRYALLAYLLLMLLYTLWLKHQPILDVIVIASGFVIRTVAGALAIQIYISPWLVFCTFTLCLFLGFSKRRNELSALPALEHAREHRKSLSMYNADLLNQLLSTSAGVALVTFMLYVMDTDVAAHQATFDKRPLMYTFPLVAYGLFRYTMLITSGSKSGPTEIILQDRTLVAVILIWLVTSAVIILWAPLRTWF